MKTCIKALSMAGLILLFNACQKEETLSTFQQQLAQYPSEMTIDNWEEFVHAPQAVLDHHAKQIESNPQIQVPQENQPAGKKANPPCNNYKGWVKAWSGGWTQMANTMVEASYFGSPQFTEITDLSTPYNWCNDHPITTTNLKWYFNSNTATYTQPEWVNGVSTLDLIIISQHILGIQPFTSLRQYIAADANFDATITQADINLIQQLILVNTTQLPAGGVVCNPVNQPFFYILDSDYDYFNNLPNNGSIYLSDMYMFNCVSTANTPSTTSVIMNAYAIKRGDVSGNWGP